MHAAEVFFSIEVHLLLWVLNSIIVYLIFVAVSLAKVANKVKAADIRVLFVKPLVYWTRFFIILTAFSNAQIDAIRYSLLCIDFLLLN